MSEQMTPSPAGPRRLTALLAWYREMGVTAALDTEPTDWRARGNVAPGATYMMPQAVAPVAAARVTAPTVGSKSFGGTATPGPPPQRPSQSPAQRPARDLPAAYEPERRAGPVRVFAPPVVAPQSGAMLPTTVTAGSLSELAAALQAFDGCKLKATAKNLCLYRGAEQAPLMVIGEAPGREEDDAGRPFIGPAGQLLDRMLAAISLTEADVHITTVVYWRPPGNRAVTAQEALACAPFMSRQIELVAPKIILVLGGPATQHLLGQEEPIMKLRGKWLGLANAGRQIAVLPTLHPAHVLKAPASKRQVWRDLLAVKAALTTNGDP